MALDWVDDLRDFTSKTGTPKLLSAEEHAELMRRQGAQHLEGAEALLDQNLALEEPPDIADSTKE